MARRSPAPLDLAELLRTLARHKVRFVIIGGIAGNIHGSATLTRDLDIVYDRERENIRRLAAALSELDAHRRDVPAGVAAPVDERAILSGQNFLLTTKFGPLDCLGETPAERYTYQTLLVDANRFVVDDDLTIAVASIDDLIRMKRATGRERDRIEVERLMALRDEHELREPAGPYRRPRKGRQPKAAASHAPRRGKARPARPSPSRPTARARSGRARAAGRGRA